MGAVRSVTVETRSEALFKQHCEARGVSYQRIQEEGRKVADFEIALSSGAAVVEIKQLDPNERDLAREAMPPGVVAGAANAPSGRLRNLLSDAYRQIKPYGDRGVPGIVVCYNNAGGINFIDNFSITRAMFGGMAVYLSLGQDGAIHHTGQGFTGNRKVTPTSFRALSAVGVLSTPTIDSTKLRVYHNPYASNPLSVRTLQKLADEQFGYSDPHGARNPEFLAHRLEV